MGGSTSTEATPSRTPPWTPPRAPRTVLWPCRGCGRLLRAGFKDPNDEALLSCYRCMRGFEVIPEVHCKKESETLFLLHEDPFPVDCSQCGRIPKLARNVRPPTDRP
jgi:hypothetical protein